MAASPWYFAVLYRVPSLLCSLPDAAPKHNGGRVIAVRSTQKGKTSLQSDILLTHLHLEGYTSKGPAIQIPRCMKIRARTTWAPLLVAEPHRTIRTCPIRHQLAEGGNPCQTRMLR
jgi:hypothetical protein